MEKAVEDVEINFNSALQVTLQVTFAVRILIFLNYKIRVVGYTKSLTFVSTIIP